MAEVKRGDKITTIVKGELATVLTVNGPLSYTWSVRVYRERKISGSIYPLKALWPVILEPRLEGVTWARGWDGEAAGALRAQIALQRSQ